MEKAAPLPWLQKKIVGILRMYCNLCMAATIFQYEKEKENRKSKGSTTREIGTKRKLQNNLNVSNRKHRCNVQKNKKATPFVMEDDNCMNPSTVTTTQKEMGIFTLSKKRPHWNALLIFWGSQRAKWPDDWYPDAKISISTNPFISFTISSRETSGWDHPIFPKTLNLNVFQAPHLISDSTKLVTGLDELWRKDWEESPICRSVDSMENLQCVKTKAMACRLAFRFPAQGGLRTHSSKSSYSFLFLFFIFWFCVFFYQKKMVRKNRKF